MSVRDYAVEAAEINAVVAGDTLPRAFLRTVAANPGVVALRRMVGEGSDGWEETTYGQLGDEVAAVAAGLEAAGLRPGQRMVLMMRNRPEFHVVDLAATFLRATPVSIYNSSSAEELQYLVDHAEAEIAVVEDVGFLERFLKVRANCRGCAASSSSSRRGTKHLTTWTPMRSCSPRAAADLEVLAEATDPNDLATLIYTSGTTGPPKGVMISQHNVVHTCEQLTRCYEFVLGDDDGVGLRYISYLPMAHIAERISSHYNGMRLGFTITCCPDPAQIAAYAREVHPEVMFGVPRVWEKVYLGVNAALAADRDKKQKFDEAVAAALPIIEARRQGTITRTSKRRGTSSMPWPSPLCEAWSGSTRCVSGSPVQRRSRVRSSSGSTPSASRSARSMA